MSSHIAIEMFYAEFESSVSADRLTPFRTVSGNQLETMVNYFWNIALCQALYPQLNMLEVATRNSLHSFLSTHFDRPDWYDQPNFLQRRELDDLAKAKRNILRTHASFRPGHVIAALNFGFWVSLLDSLYGEKPYGPQLWGPFPSPNLALVFPHAPASHQRYRRRLHGRLDDMRLLRNRISHYEPIWRGISLPSRRTKTPPRIVLPHEIHSPLAETIGWISPGVRDTMDTLDIFPIVEQRGTDMIEKRLKRQLRDLQRRDR